MALDVALVSFAAYDPAAAALRALAKAAIAIALDNGRLPPATRTTLIESLRLLQAYAMTCVLLTAQGCGRHGGIRVGSMPSAVQGEGRDVD